MHPCDNNETLLRVLKEPRRNNYFYGKRMDVQHFQMEQDYGKLKQWLINRLTFGKGVVCGLKVSIDGDKLCVDPGFAIDGLGREIVVPVRACIDPVTQEGGCCAPCCGEPAATPAPGLAPVPVANPVPPSVDLAGTPEPTAQPKPQLGSPLAAQPAMQPAASVGVGMLPPAVTPVPPTGEGIFTLWVCYKECRTDYQPVLVSDCGTREQCAPGTIVESFCLKMTPGVPNLQGDPDWCAKLWPKPKPPAPDPKQPIDPTHGLNVLAAADHAHLAALSGVNAKLPTAGNLQDALTSRRHLLCELFDDTCAPAEGDSCVPLALVLLRGKRVVRFESCLVRPRVYSNEVLLDLILCLAAKIEECCNHKPLAETMRVKSVEFLAGANDTVIVAVGSPLAETAVPIQKQSRAIRVKFTQPFDQGANKATTPGLNEKKWQHHNFLVVPEGGPVAGFEYVPGELTVEAPDTLRWELNPESPFYTKNSQGWQKGRLRLSIYGDPDASNKRVALNSAAGAAFDGEPIAPAAGAMSGEGNPGGIFTMTFKIG